MEYENSTTAKPISKSATLSYITFVCCLKALWSLRDQLCFCRTTDMWLWVFSVPREEGRSHARHLTAPAHGWYLCFSMAVTFSCTRINQAPKRLTWNSRALKNLSSLWIIFLDSLKIVSSVFQRIVCGQAGRTTYQPSTLTFSWALPYYRFHPSKIKLMCGHFVPVSILTLLYFSPECRLMSTASREMHPPVILNKLLVELVTLGGFWRQRDGHSWVEILKSLVSLLT